MTSGDRLRIGVIGCGVGVLHLEGFEHAPHAEAVALAGLDVDRCAKLQTRFAVPKRYVDYREMLADPDIDAVTVAVPNSLHREVAIAALEAGKHVLVEKPLAQSSADGAEMVAAAARTGSWVVNAEKSGITRSGWQLSMGWPML